MASSKFNLNNIHSMLYSGTTDERGRLFTDINIANKIIVGLLSSTNGQIVLQLRIKPGNTLAIKFFTSDTMTPIANTQCECNVYYMSI